MRLTSARALSYVAFAVLLLSGWLGGELVFKGRVGIDEPSGPPSR
jgi:hypothetical protein